MRYKNHQVYAVRGGRPGGTRRYAVLVFEDDIDVHRLGGVDRVKGQMEGREQFLGLDVGPLCLLDVVVADLIVNKVCGAVAVDNALLRQHTRHASQLADSVHHLRDEDQRLVDGQAVEPRQGVCEVEGVDSVFDHARLLLEAGEFLLCCREVVLRPRLKRNAPKNNQQNKNQSYPF